MSELQPQETPALSAWEAIGSWPQGTAVAVALGWGEHGVHRLIGAPSGLYAWDAQAQPAPVLRGVVDPNIVAVAMSGQGVALTALAATASGRLMRSQVPGYAWSEMDAWAGLGVATVVVPAPDFVQSGVLFVGTPAGIFRTLDAGVSWESCNFGLLDEDVLCLACAPNFAQSEQLWAGTAGGGLYRSRNAGRAWRDSGIGLPDAAVQALAVSPNFEADRTLFVGLEEQGVYRSTDGGEAWQPWALSGLSVNALVCAENGALWAGTNAGLFAIASSGGVEALLNEDVTVLALAADAVGDLLVGTYGAGVYDSHDAGVTWRNPAPALHAPPVVLITNAGYVALDNDGAMARSLDDGATWESLPSASDMGVFGMAGTTLGGNAQSHAELVLFAATGTGLVRWDDAAAHWQPVGVAHFGARTPLAVDVSPTYGHDQSILAVMHDDKLLLSQDDGASWQDVTGPWTDQTILRAGFGPISGAALLALTVLPTSAGHFDVSVWQSLDRGQAWSGLATLTSGLPAVLVAWPQDAHDQAIFLATQHRVVKLFHAPDDAGIDELSVHQSFFAEGTRITALHADAEYATSGVVWAATTEGVMRSTDRGLTWTQVGGLPQDLPLVWLQATHGRLRGIALGGACWLATL